MPALTPIKVRGKRHGTPWEKWNAGKKRETSLVSTPVLSDTASTCSRSSNRASKRRMKLMLSSLELLPVEILQDIFEISLNVSLPGASLALATMLTSEYMKIRFTSRMLIIESSWCVPFMFNGSAEATRLLNCRWFTWSFFQRWLALQYQTYYDLSTLPPGIVTNLADPAWLRWHGIYPARWNGRFVLPSKLLTGPWTSDKQHFLRWLSNSAEASVGAPATTNADLAAIGLQHAFEEQSPVAVHWLLRTGTLPTRELLRSAIMDNNCNRIIVYQLVWQNVSLRIRWSVIATQNSNTVVNEKATNSMTDVDYLDNSLWSWAAKAELEGSTKGPWLKELLRRAGQSERMQSLNELAGWYVTCCDEPEGDVDDLNMVIDPRCFPTDSDPWDLRYGMFRASLDGEDSRSAA